MTVPFFNNNVDQFVTDLSDWYKIAGQDHYDEVVTLSDHMLQAASIAYDEGLSKSNVLSCLFHDIGHMIIDDKDNPSDLIGNIYHETIAASFLSDIFINDVVEPVKNHVKAKRWLCTSNKNYYDQLSPASKQSFEEQGSYMTIEEMKSKLVESNMKYVHDMVIQDRYEELYDYVETHYFSDFQDLEDGEIIEMYGWLTEHSEEEA